MHMMQTHYSANPYASMATTTSQPQIKSEPVDSRYMLTPNVYVPGLPGPNLNRSLPPPQPAPPHPGGQTGVIQFSRPAQTSQQTSSTRSYVPPAQPLANRALSIITANGHPSASANQSALGGQRIPQLDGPSESSGEEESPGPTGYGPRPSHPSLPQPGSVQSSQQTSVVPKDDEAINSDLDDSDTENEAEAEEGGAGDTDIVFCTYDKVCSIFSVSEELS